MVPSLSAQRSLAIGFICSLSFVAAIVCCCCLIWAKVTLWSYSSSLEESPTPESSSEAAEPSFSFSFLECGLCLFRPGNGGTLVSGWRLASERSGFSFLFHFPPAVLSSLSLPSFATKYNSSSAFSAAQPLEEKIVILPWSH